MSDKPAGASAMAKIDRNSHFKAKLLCPARAERDTSWAFVLLRKDASEKLPRRGRTTIEGKINGCKFLATLDPDGQLSHWLKVSRKLYQAAGAAVGDIVTLDIVPVEKEPEPDIPEDLLKALSACADALQTWNDTTPIARLDWVHWITSAKQLKTRSKRIGDACEMLASGNKRVCCFDNSGHYSKAFRAPEAADFEDDA